MIRVPNPDQLDENTDWAMLTEWEGEHELVAGREPVPARLRDRLEHQGTGDDS